MLNFARLNIGFGLLLITGSVLSWLGIIHWYVYLILLLPYSLLLFYGCYYIGSNFFIRIVCKLETDEKIIALTFDDGPHAVNTPKLLQILQDHGAEAAFFCIGKNIPANADLLKEMDQRGHIIGNHSYSHHYWFDMYSANKMEQDIRQMTQVTEAIIGKTPVLFRPPYGVTNPNLAKAIKACGLTPIGWSVRSYDTMAKDPAKLLTKMERAVKPGAIFLFHDTSDAMLDMLPQFLQGVKTGGYKVVRLDKMLNLQAYA